MPVRHVHAFAAAHLLLMAYTAVMRSQQENGAPSPETRFVLHAYAEHIQIPTLVVDAKNSLPPPLPRDRFNIRLDSGPVFHPTQMRVEGDDPISLAIVLDDSGSQTVMLSLIGSALAALAPGHLHPADRISVYIVDCKIFRTATNEVALSSLLKDAVERAIEAPGLHGGQPEPACGRSLRLWDTASFAAKTLADSPGRRAMLIVSSGKDEKSKLTFRQLSEFTGEKSIAIFGLRDLAAPVGMQPGGKGPIDNPESPLDLLCAANGGLVFNIDRRDIEATLQNFVTLLRGRYILEFPAPDKGGAGVHNLSVKVTGRGSLTVRAAGASANVPDPARFSDPSTIKASPSPAIFGTRKPLPSNP